METIKKRYIVDENNNKLAVEIDIETFVKIEEILENYALYKLMQESEESGSLSFTDAKTYYDSL